MKTTAISLVELVETQEAPSVIIDKDYYILAANRKYCASYGISPEEVTGKRCHEVSHHSAVPCHLNGEQCPHKEVFSSGKPYEVLHTHYDFQNRPDHVRIKAHPLRDIMGKSMLMESIHRLAPSVNIMCEEMHMVGKSPAFLTSIENLAVAAKSDGSVLIYGESGVGKELAAKFIHQRSARNKRPYVELNCAAIPESLCESELFGHERGAFTGCVGMRRGLFEVADKGILFLDEIGELPLSMQAKLLRVLDSGEFRRLGGHDLIGTDVRVIAATNCNLMSLVEKGKFRQDLYFRIAGIKVNMPPLRERRTDIPFLAEELLRKICKHQPMPCRLAPDAVDRLLAYDYPGNVRELRNILVKAVALSDGRAIDATHIHFDHQSARLSGSTKETARLPLGEIGVTEPSGQFIGKMEYTHITGLLQRHNGNRRVVAGILGISERTLYRKLRRYKKDGADTSTSEHAAYTTPLIFPKIRSI